MLGWSTVALLGALSSGPAASDPGMMLEWSAPAGCPSQTAVRQRLSDALADSAADPRGMRARALVTQDDAGGLTLELELARDDGPGGRRTMQARDCHELAKAVVLIVALAVDPDVDLDALPVEPPPDPVPVPVPVPEPGTPTMPEPEPAPPSEPAPLDPAPSEAPEPEPPEPNEPREPARRQASALPVGLYVTAGAGLSVLPKPTAVLSLGAATWGRAWRAELGASYWTPVDTFPTGDTTGGRIQQWTLDARGCGLLRPGPLEIPLCAGVDGGAVHGKGLGLPAARQVTSLRLALAAGAALVWAPARLRGRLALRLDAEGLVALVRARFRASPAAPGLVYYTPLVGGRVSAGLEVRLR
ncbi:MAG: hypothetical protein KDK70_25060 [Myxococcales bacterium]|nr:hypothetical protein [Myxococcales bacterium]